MIKLEDLNHFKSDKRIRFSEEDICGETVTIVSYMIADTDLWGIHLARECRGITFDKFGNCICRPLEKFFNIGENSYVQLNDIRHISFECLAKRDGSMLNPVLVQNNLFWKTKKSFYSDVAVFAAKHVSHNIERLSKYLLGEGLCPTYEFTSDENKIVIHYSTTPEFTLIAIRDMNSGQYLSYEYMQKVCDEFGVSIIERYNLTVEDCIEQAATLEDFEGWCLRDVETGFYCKQKTQWYLRNHRAQTELRERDVADMVVDETIDDIKSALALDGFDIAPIEEIENNVSNQFVLLRDAVEFFVKGIVDKTDFKRIANAYKDHKFFGLIMSAVRGKEPDYKKFWVNNYRNAYSLKCVYNKNF